MKNTILRKISLIALIAVTLGFSSNIYAELGIVEEKIENTIEPTVKETETCSEDKYKFDGTNEFELFGEAELTNKEICSVNTDVSFLDVIIGSELYFNTSKDSEKDDFIKKTVGSDLTSDEYEILQLLDTIILYDVKYIEEM